MPDWFYEDKHQGLIVGIDEAGRGPWAGPVAAGAVLFYKREINPVLLSSLNDSKKLTAKKRESLYALLEDEQKNGALRFAVGLASAAEIDKLNILQATFLAMRRAVENLHCQVDFALIDGNRTPQNFMCPVETIVKGDALSLSISAASVAAKVYRDRLMVDMSRLYPEYGFEQNAGYGTKKHIEALKKYGVTPIHRRSFRPVAEVIAGTF